MLLGDAGGGVQLQTWLGILSWRFVYTVRCSVTGYGDVLVLLL